jgi:hypothetical protein
MCCDTPFSYCYASGVPFCPHPGACPATCTTDTECQSQCPANDAGATVCCDTGSGQCYQSGSSVCPQDVACGAPCVTEADCQSMCPTPRPGHVDCCMQGSCFYVVDGGCPVSPYP